MLVLFLAVLLLVVAPAMLLWVGRAIHRVTDGLGGPRMLVAAAPAFEPAGGDPWYRRKMRPAFYRIEDEEGDAPTAP